MRPLIKAFSTSAAYDLVIVGGGPGGKISNYNL